jgi:CelD/BcsL family acetyltransferase involved in cellulose biosynthesis
MPARRQDTLLQNAPQWKRVLANSTGGPREADFVASIRVHSDELGRGCGLFLLYYGKERRLDQQPICAPSPAASLISPDLKVELISDPEEFLRLRDAWDGLLSKCAIPHPFMSHLWIRTWWESFGTSEQLRIFVVKAGAKWVAVAPMMVRRGRMYGIPIRRLEALYNPHTTRYEFPIRARHDDVHRALWNAFSESDGGWDAVVLQQFPEKSASLDIFQRFARRDGWSTGRWTGPASPYIALGCTYDDVLNRLTNKERYNLRRRYNNLAAHGEIELEIIADRTQVFDALQDGLRIEAAAWKGSAGTAMISSPQVRHFYSKLAERAADRGWLRLAFLRVGGKRIAFLYMLDTRGVSYAMKVGYDPEYHRHSPGHLLLTLVLKDACERGCREFDFQGAKEKWKLVWTRESRTHPWLFLFRDRLRPRLLHHAKFAVLPALRRSHPDDGNSVARGYSADS